MSDRNKYSKLKRFCQNLSGSATEYNLTEYYPILDEISKYRIVFENKSDFDLKIVSRILRRRALNGEPLDDLLPEAYALVREAIKRILKLTPFDVQLIGGIVIHQGRIAEMQTGEGKTLTAVFPAFLNALTMNGVHILTFNDYLAKRDAEWMGPVYEFLNLSVGFIQERMSIEDRKKAYNCDITYLTSKEAGFDYLRDGLCFSAENIVHRNFNYAIIDEADSILIDEARIPLIIAESVSENIINSYYMATIARELKENTDFALDEYGRNIHYTESGIKHIQDLLKCENIYAEENIEQLTMLNCAIHAEYLLQKDVDYIIKNGKIELVDEFTGRIADKRRWPDGLQAALEAKEKMDVQSRGRILNSITIQHFVQLYSGIGGMTATARSSEKEFMQFYDLKIIVIPSNKPCIRVDEDDVIFRTTELKNCELVNEIGKVHKIKRPILVGTRSVRESIHLAGLLEKNGIKCEILNARNDEYEAKIIAQAGRLGAVTISTNMAGRGTDIKLGGADEVEKDEVLALGGLYVIGTNRHESPRIDNQLRGRAGRQGDPGSSKFFISLEDDLFIKYKLKDLIPHKISFIQKQDKIDHPYVKSEINRIQRIIDGQNLEIKKTVYKYSSLIEQQRKIISQKRNDILLYDNIMEFIQKESPVRYVDLALHLGKNELSKITKSITLSQIDNAWSGYLAEINDIREGIHFRRLGGQDPVYEFQKLSVEIFGKLQEIIDENIIESFEKIILKGENVDLEKSGIKAPSSTWTYLVNDNTFEDMLGIQIMGNIGLQVWAGLFGPLLALLNYLKKKEFAGKK
jgi:preprotein translocase subunit SecA